MADSGIIFGPSNISGVTYGIGLAVGIFVLVMIITLISYYCTNYQISTAQALQLQGFPEPSDRHSITVEEGFDETTLQSFPKVLYSQAKLGKDTTASCCSICLCDYEETDMLRLLPACGHLFHVKCVEPWLRLHPTCPVCRNSPAPTPLTELAPFSSQPG